MAARDAVTGTEHPAVGDIPVVEHPQISEHRETGFGGPQLLLGEDTGTVLSELSYSEDRIARLREDSVIPDPPGR